MSNDPGSTNLQWDCLGEWLEKDTLKLSNKSFEISYTSKPPIFDHIVTVVAKYGEMVLFTALFDLLPPHDLMKINLHGIGSTVEAAEIIRFLSNKIKAPVRLDMSMNDSIFTEEECQCLGSVLQIIPHTPRAAADRQKAIDGAV
jgi:hypothetical protein